MRHIENGKIETAELKGCKVFVGTPCYGGQVHVDFMMSLMELMKMSSQVGVDVQFSFIKNESLITRGRNNIVKDFIKSNCTHLLFVDSDIKFIPSDVFKLLYRDVSVIGGAYPKKGINWEKIKNASDKNKESLELYSTDFVINTLNDKTVIEDNCLKVKDIGTGFMLVKRDVILEMIKCFPETHYLKYTSETKNEEDRKMYALFDTYIEPSTKEYLSEDYCFCRRCITMGVDIWLDCTVNLNHIGNYSFKGNVVKFLSGE